MSEFKDSPQIQKWEKECVLKSMKYGSKNLIAL